MKLIHFCRPDGLLDQLVGRAVDLFLLMTRMPDISGISKAEPFKICLFMAESIRYLCWKLLIPNTLSVKNSFQLKTEKLEKLAKIVLLCELSYFRSKIRENFSFSNKYLIQ